MHVYAYGKTIKPLSSASRPTTTNDNLSYKIIIIFIIIIIVIVKTVIYWTMLNKDPLNARGAVLNIVSGRLLFTVHPGLLPANGPFVVVSVKSMVYKVWYTRWFFSPQG